MIKYILILLLITQFILFVIALIKRGRPRWDLLLKTQILSIICLVFYYVINGVFNKYDNWNSLGVFFRTILYGFIYTISLVISLIIRSKVQIETIENNIKQIQFILLGSIILLVSIATMVDIKPFIVEKNNRETFSKIVVEYLNSKYGNGEFKVSNITDNGKCFLGCGPDTYTFKMTSKHLNNTFFVDIDKTTKKVESDGFMIEYTKQNKWCEEPKENKSSECILESFYYDEDTYYYSSEIYKVFINLEYNQKYLDLKYGKLPEIGDIKRNIYLEFNNFSISKEFSSEEEFKSFIIDFYKKYLEGYSYENIRSVEFKFENGNPFSKTDEQYKNSGYIKEDNNSLYIYYKNEPVVISKSQIN